MTEFTELQAEVRNQSSIKPLKLFFLLRYESKYKIILWFGVFFYFYNTYSYCNYISPLKIYF